MTANAPNLEQHDDNAAERVPSPSAREGDATDSQRPAVQHEDSGDAPTQSVESRRISEATVVCIVLAGILGLMTFDVLVSQWPARRLPVDRLPQRQFNFRLDVNTANAMELIQLPGIGPTLAERIVADRDANGPFRSLDDLTRVRGIGPAIAEQIAPYLTWPDE